MFTFKNNKTKCIKDRNKGELLMKKLLYLILGILIAASVTMGCNNDDSTRLTYGNYCGPGHTGPGAPVDDLDDCCMAHDTCYEDNSIDFYEYAVCRDGEKRTCDEAFVQCMIDITTDTTIWVIPPQDNTLAINYYNYAYDIFNFCINLKSGDKVCFNN